ncbi:MAG: hypothetical protein AAGF87_09375 [Bacteroidota bacterium]
MIQPQYIIDQDGNPTAVVLSIKDWETLQPEIAKKQREDLEEQLREAFKEVDDARAGKIELQTLESYIDELKSKANQKIQERV